jgi:hypothetical protein
MGRPRALCALARASQSFRHVRNLKSAEKIAAISLLA